MKPARRLCIPWPTWVAEGATKSRPTQEGEAADEEQPRRTHKERFRLQWAHVISPSKEWKRGFYYSPNAYIEPRIGSNSEHAANNAKLEHAEEGKHENANIRSITSTPSEKRWKEKTM